MTGVALPAEAPTATVQVEPSAQVCPLTVVAAPEAALAAKAVAIAFSDARFVSAPGLPTVVTSASELPQDVPLTDCGMPAAGYTMEPPLLPPYRLHADPFDRRIATIVPPPVEHADVVSQSTTVARYEA
jgi:hypothetical protein